MIISATKAGEAAEILGVGLDTLTTDALGKAYRSKAKECHPDHHGSTKLQLWARISWAQECLERWLKQHPVQDTETVFEKGDCRACEGTGRVKVRSGNYRAALTMACIVCKGIGTVIPEEDDHD